VSDQALTRAEIIEVWKKENPMIMTLHCCASCCDTLKLKKEYDCLTCKNTDCRNDDYYDLNGKNITGEIVLKEQRNL